MSPSLAVSKRRIDSIAQAFVGAGLAPGLSVTVIRGGDTLLLRGVGFEDVESETPMSSTSVVQYASITKQFVSAAVLQLVGEGRVALHARVDRYVKDLPAAWQGATVAQLLNHTAGLPNFVVRDTAWERRFAEPMTPREILKQVADKPLRFAPGDGWEYTGTGYVVLGLLIESVTGAAWDVDLQRRFLVPLGLHSVRYCRRAPIIPHRAAGYERIDGVWQNMRPLDLTQRYTAGALCGTAVDVARWSAALHTGRVLADSLYRQMTTPSGSAKSSGYGFGIYADTVAGEPVLYHGGSNHGFSTATVWVPSQALSVTVLANGGFAPTKVLWQQIVRAALGRPLASASR